MSAHTPGPWKSRVDARGWYRIGPNVRIEPKAGGNPAIRAADARLIAAAPELLEALKGMQQAADEIASEFIQKKRAANWGIINDAYVATNHAITKATQP